MAQIIINADDFGYSKAVNYGIIDSYLDGVVRSTTLMANMDGFDHAVDLAKKHRGLAVGVHLTISTGRPLTDLNQGFLDKNGDFKRRSFYFDEDENPIFVAWMDSMEVYREWKAQIEKVLSTGLEISHLDSHHHIHFHRDFKPIAKKLAEEYGLLLRDENPRVDYFDRYFDEVLIQKNLDFKKLDKRLKSMSSHQVIELICHPAYMDKNLLEGSSFNLDRIYELDNLTNPQFKRILDIQGHELISYRDL